MRLPNEKIEGKYIGSVKVGSKGQIVIPKEVRDLFNIKTGDTLIMLADIERGVAIQGYELFQKMLFFRLRFRAVLQKRIHNVHL